MTIEEGSRHGHAGRQDHDCDRGRFGYGRASAERFANEGAKVFCVDKSGEEEIAAKEIGDNAFALHADVSLEADVQRMIATAESEFGRLDVLYNNAGTAGSFGPLHEQTLEDWEFMQANNIRAAFLGMKYGIISMLKTGGGSIINTASAAALVGWKDLSTYSAVKAGILQLTKSGALDYATQNIRINAICPGATWTALVPAAIETGTVGKTPPPGYATIPNVPMDRWVLANEIAGAAVFLASDYSSGITGIGLPVDCGYVCP